MVAQYVVDVLSINVNAALRKFYVELNSLEPLRRFANVFTSNCRMSHGLNFPNVHLILV